MRPDILPGGVFPDYALLHHTRTPVRSTPIRPDHRSLRRYVLSIKHLVVGAAGQAAAFHTSSGRMK